MAAWGIALGIITMVGTVIFIAVVVAGGSTHPISTSGWDRATHFGLNQSYYTSAFQGGENAYKINVFAANNGLATQSAKQACDSAGNARQTQACIAGFNNAVAANGPVPPRTNLYQKGYNEGVSYAQQEQRTAAQGGIPNTPQEDCVAGVGPANQMPATLTREEQGCVDGFKATYPNEYDNSTTTTSTTIAPSTLDYNTGYSMGVGLAASLPGESASVACAGLGDAALVQGCEAGFNAGKAGA